MVQQNRSKEVWLIPKRGSLHQTVCLIESLNLRRYDQSRWNEQKQNNVGNDLRKRGAVKTRNTPSNQSIRTLLASVPQYFGFLYIDTSTTPSTIKLTEAGKRLYDYHKDQLKDIGTLGLGKANNELIEASPIVLEQFEKLQITNPIILKDCENILVFPFRVTLQLLLELDYLDREEIAYFLFAMRNEDEIPLMIEKVKRFRQQSSVDRDREIAIFKQTHIGNITLVKASSASYFEGLCVNTGIINKVSRIKPNSGYSIRQKIASIEIKEEHKEYAENVIKDKYRNADIYDFKNNLKLWIDYIGEPSRLIPPKDLELINDGNEPLIMTVEKNNVIIGGDLVQPGEFLLIPMFINESYEVVLISPLDGQILDRIKLVPDFIEERYEFKAQVGGAHVETMASLCNRIIEHISVNTFDSNYVNYLNIISPIIGSDLVTNKNLRGAYLEYLFYELLEMLRIDEIIEDVFWNGSRGHYGLPRPAPGGRTGIPDIVFKLNNEFFVLELTTIKPKAMQFSAEGSSVPDHIKLFAEDNPTITVNGVFSAPQIHDRNTNAMQSILNPIGITLKCINIIDLINLFQTKDPVQIFNSLKTIP